MFTYDKVVSLKLFLTCGAEQNNETLQAQININLPRRLASFTLRGCSTAKYLSSETQISTLLLRYKPKARRNRNALHAAFPANHCTVTRQPI